jgi:hypothetical protein
MTKKISKVCITDEKSIQYTATNSLELIEKIKEQIVSKIENGSNIGVFGTNGNDQCILLEKAAFFYDNPQISGGKLYVDFKLLDTPYGNILQQLSDSNVTYRSVVEGIGIIMGDKSIADYILTSVNVLSPGS